MKRKVANLIVVVVACLTLSTVLVSINSLSVSAEGQLSAQDLTNKVLLNAIKTCYTDKYMKTEIDAKDYSSFANIFTKDGTKDGVIKVPTMVGNTLTDSDVSCKEVFLGYRQGKGSNSITGLFLAYGKTSAINDLPYLGFDHENGENPNNVQEGCLGFSYARPDPNSSSSIVSETNQVCFRVSGASGKETIELNNDDPATYRGEANGPISIYYDSLDRAIYISTPPEVSGNYKWQLSGSSNWTTIKQDFQSYVENALSAWVNYATSENLGYQLRSMTSTELGETTYFDKYTKRGDNGGAGALRALRYITSNGGTTWDSIKFTDEDIYNLYLQYYNNTVNKYQSVYTGDCYDTEEAAKAQSAYYIQSSDKKWCTVYGVSQVTEKFNMVADSRDKLVSGDSYDFAKVLTRLVEFSKVIDTSTVAPDISGPTTPTEPDNGSGDVGSDLGSCFTSAASLGWIICPVTQMAGNAVQNIYKDIKESYLEVKPDFVSTESGTYYGWEKFRDFANIAFAIVLLIIILSQVTGIGVTNYGIKKTLPSLIIVAVLVNLSFFICQLAVDISNVTGDWLERFFMNLTVTGGEDVSAFGIGDLVGGMVSTLMTGTAAAVGISFAGVTWEIWLLPLLLTILVTLIGVLFFYILLAARQAVIIILVVISPLAFICYALPNTKKMFERWWKLFSAMLLLYPICGALMGGGVFASRLLIRSSTENFFFKLVAVLLQVVPFFFIPTLLRNSFSALGSLGVRMANFGRNLGQRVNRSISNSEGFRDVNRRLSMNNALRGYNRIRSGRGAVNTLSRGLHRIGLNGAGNAVDAYNRRRSAQFMDSYRKGRLEDIKAEVGSYPMTEREEAALRDQIQMGQLDDLAEAYESDYRASGQADNERYMIKEHANALAALRANPEDREAKARLMGIHNILRTSDSGRTGMQNNLYAAAADMQSHEQTADAGLRYAASHMLRTDGAMYKAKNKGLHSFLLDAAQDDIKFNRSNFTHTTPDAEGNVRYNNDYYDGAKIGSWSGAALAGADEGALDRMFSSVGVMNRNSQAYQNLTTDERIRVNSDRSSLDISTREALTNPNIELQPKIRDKINMIRRQAGLAAIQPPDTTRINIPRNRRGRRRR